MYKIMLIDDESNILSALQRAFQQQPWDIEIYQDATEALKRAKNEKFDLFLSDYRMPFINGVEFLTQIKSIQPDAIRLLLSAQTDKKVLFQAINKVEVYRFLEKPWQDEELISNIAQALIHKKILLENKLMAEQLLKQQDELNQHQRLIDEFKIQHPKLFQVKRSANGAIILDDNE